MKFLSNILIKAGLTVDGATQLNTITNATIDTDKFLVSDGGVVKYRTGAQVLSDIGAASANGYVPYVGATTNVDLGEFELKAGQFTLDVSPTGTAAVGTTRWNNTIGSSETTLKGGTVILKNGVDLVARVVNKVFPNATLTKAAYQAVRVSGAQGQRLAVSYAQADGDPNSADTIGLVTETIATNQEGFIMTVGQLEGINTTGSLQGETWTDGDVLYLSPTIPGAITNIKPSAPQHLVVMGYVEYAHANNGKIYVKIMNGWELGELHDVNTTGAINGSVLKYNGTIWVPSSDTGITSLNGLTALSQSFATGTSGTDFNIASATATHTFNLPTASATNRGALSTADWTTFNGKQAALNGTGFVKISGTTISYDNSTYYLASNPSAFIALTALSATAPLSYSNTTGVFSISQATTSTNGYLSSTDWNTFNNKQPAGSYITALTGEATASGPGSATVTLSTSAVTGKLLTGLNLTGGGSIAATDSILQAFGKVQNQISGLAGGVTYQGVWNASTNTPTLTSSVGTKGYYYIVDVAGSTNLNGITDWKVGDWVIFNGSTWDKVDNTDAVSSVNGFTGAVSLTTSNIAEGTNLYYLDSRARLALSFTAGSGAYNNTTGVITIPTNTSQLTNGANFITLSSLSASSPLAYNSGTGAFSIQVANGSQNGYLSSTDWTTFNSKQAALTLTTTGSSGSSTLVGATLNVPTYTLSGLGGVPTSRQLTINGTAYDLSADRSWSVGTVTSVGLSSATSGVTIGSTPITTSGTITLAIATASGSQQGLLSSTDWTTFNNKQNALTNPVTGTGTTNTLSKFTGASTIGNSNVTDTGSLITLGSTSYVNGSLGIGVQAPLAPLQLGDGYTDTGYDGFRNTGSPSLLMAYGQTSVIHRILGGVYSQAATVNLDLSLAISKNKGTGSGFRITSGVGTGVGTSNNYLSFSSLTGALDETFTATEYMRLDANGSLGIGTTSLTGYSLRVSKNITGATNALGIVQGGIIQNDVTNVVQSYTSSLNTQATAFNLTQYSHYVAEQGTIGAGSSITTQNGFYVISNLTGATNNYAFRSTIAAGTGRWNIFMDGTANNYMAGSLGIGTTSVGASSLTVAKTITGGTSRYGIYQAGQVQSDVTTLAIGIYNQSNTAGSAFTLGSYVHLLMQQGTIGAGSAITNQYGVFIDGTLTGATNNYGIYSSLAAGTNRWNLYFAGTAANYMAGNLRIGTTTTDGTSLLEVAGNVNFNGSGSRTVAITRDSGSTLLLQSSVTATGSFIFTSTNGPLNLGANNTNNFVTITTSGQLGVNATSPNASAKVQIDSTTSGFLPPRQTQAQRTAISSPAVGLIVYQTDGVEGLWLNTSTGWRELTVV
jgi:hypothetical protein